MSFVVLCKLILRGCLRCLQVLLAHYDAVIMTTISSQITSLTVVYSTVYSDADQRKHQSSASLAFVWGIHRDRWIPRTKGQLRGKCFHLMTSSWHIRRAPVRCFSDIVWLVLRIRCHTPQQYEPKQLCMSDTRSGSCIAIINSVAQLFLSDYILFWEIGLKRKVLPFFCVAEVVK